MSDFMQFVPSRHLVKLFLPIYGNFPSVIARKIRKRKTKSQTWGEAKKSVASIPFGLFCYRRDILQMKGKLASDVVIDRAGVMSSLFKDLLIDGILFRGPSTDVDLFVGMFATELRNFVSSSGKLTGDSFEVEWRDGEVIFTVTSLPEPVTVPGWAKASSLEKR